MIPKNWLVKTGDFLFKYRNFLFPVLLVSLFLPHLPASQHLGSARLEELTDGLAVAMVFAGLLLRAAVIGFRYIKRGGLNKKVYAEDLVTDGFFAVCRNPLYVGNLIIYTGVLVMYGSPLVLLLGLGAFLFIYTAIVAAEEHFLTEKFGDAYRAYCRDVPRWWMRWSRLKQATRGMKFNVGRVLAKDYTTIANALIALLLIQLVEEEIFYPHPHVRMLAGGIVALLLAAGIVRIFKKCGILKV
jgi:protein-S-isoprenylcysteine O-methyltransferase Ste14